MESQDYRQLQLPLPQELRNKIYNQMFQNPSLSTALNLRRVNTSANQNVKNDYLKLFRRKCREPVSVAEIRRYAQTNPTTFGYFVTDPVTSPRTFISTSHVIVLPDNRLLIHTYGIDKDTGKIKSSDVILPRTVSREELWRRLETNPELLDLATTYDILRRRFGCIVATNQRYYSDNQASLIARNKYELINDNLNLYERILRLLELHLDIVDFTNKLHTINYWRNPESERQLRSVVPKRFVYQSSIYESSQYRLNPGLLEQSLEDAAYYLEYLVYAEWTNLDNTINTLSMGND